MGKFKFLGGNIMSDKLDKILDKVKKLLSLAGNNPSEEEAIAASLKAQELIAKYNLDLTDTEKEEQEIAQAEYKTGVDKSWKYGLANVVANNFRVCSYWVDRRKVVFYGYKQDITVAVMTYEYLFKTGERGARAACRKAVKDYGTETGVYYSYTRGFTAGVKSALEVQSTALMVVTPKEVKVSYEQYSVSRGMTQVGSFRNGSENGVSKSVYYEGFKDGKAAGNSRSLDGTRNIEKR